jgi:hypothetical protein
MRAPTSRRKCWSAPAIAHMRLYGCIESRTLLYGRFGSYTTCALSDHPWGRRGASPRGKTLGALGQGTNDRWSREW